MLLIISNFDSVRVVMSEVIAESRLFFDRVRTLHFAE